MNYGDFIKINEGFHSSVNLEYDLNKREKLAGYIPTEQSVKVLGAFLRPFYSKKDADCRATVLVGPYGRGKSHLLLVLSALTSKHGNGDCHPEELCAMRLNLCEKIKRINSEIGVLAEAVVSSEVNTLPIIINSNSNDIYQAFLVAMHDALQNAKLEHLLPNTHFDAAVEVIDKWKNNFPEATKKFEKQLRKLKTSGEELYIKLKQFDQEAYAQFCQVYPEVAVGAEFNPLYNRDVVKLYTAITSALCEQTRYTGIHIIFDEFSKFLEANLDRTKMLNFKVIQDMAEAAVRSGENRIHFTCVTHKNILDYSSSDSFKTVEGRFREVRFVASSEQSYELIANAIEKDSIFSEFMQEHELDFAELNKAMARVSIFSELTQEAYHKKLVEGCFPLTPISAFSLLRVSELVGQNERTLFTFLAQNGEYTLSAFLKAERSSVSFVTVDYVYDYFQELFKKEVFNPSVHSIWTKTNRAIRQVKNKTQIRILKAIAIVLIIGDEQFKTTPAHIKAALMLEDEAFEQAVKILLQKHILSQRESSEYVLLTANGVDVKKSIRNHIDAKISKINVCETLQQYAPLGTVIPRAYNDAFSMMRFFKKIYMEASVFLCYQMATQLLSEYPYDGLVIYIVNVSNVKPQILLDKISEYQAFPELVFCISDAPFEMELLLKEAIAIQALLKIADEQGDQHYIDELEIFREDTKHQIVSSIDSLYVPSSIHSQYYNGAGELFVTKKSDLNHAISQICHIRYNSTPVINNEMVNKRILNAQNIRSRNGAVDWVLQHSDAAQIPCMAGHGAEVSIYKSAFSHTGLDIASESNNAGINATLTVMREFIVKCEGVSHCVNELYDVLLAPPFGMRKGIIPLFLAYAMRPYKQDVIIYFKGKEMELSAEVLSRLNESPQDYELLLEQGTALRDDYLNQLESLFLPYINDNVNGSNRIYRIVKSMQSWMRSLPDYSKKYTQEVGGAAVENQLISLRNELLKYEVNSRDLLLQVFPRHLRTADFNQCFQEISIYKNALDNHISNSREALYRRIKRLFYPNYRGSMPQAIMKWYADLSTHEQNHIYDRDTNELLALAKNLTSYDEQRVLDDLINIFTAISIEDWNDALCSKFLKAIEQSIKSIKEASRMEKETHIESRISLKIDNSTLERTFATSEISPLGGILKRSLSSALEEFSESIEPREKLAILASLMQEILD